MLEQNVKLIGPLKAIADVIKNLPIVTEGSGLYEVSHSDAEITYTTDSNAINNLKQTELRYAGANPNNYVNFNNELWRIVGLVNTPEGQRIKLIRSESIGSYSWDSSESSMNQGYGVNEWSTSKLKDLLNNGAYYNRTSGTCYNESNNSTVSCDFSKTGLTEEAKKLIDTVTWNTGSNDGITHKSSNIKTNNFYNLERSYYAGKLCSGGSWCNDNVARKTSWKGQVGLIYPSDYGYATSGGSTTNRMTCLNKVLYDWNNSGVSDCKNNDWLYKNKHISVISHNRDYHGSYVFAIYSSGKVDQLCADSANAIFPAVYLKTNIKIKSGNGSSSSPYDLVYE